MRKKRLLLAILILVFIIALIFAFRTDLKVMQYKISSEKIDFKIKMAFIADLHSCYYGEGQKELLDCINKHAPDIILFGGDIADDKLPHENWMITLEALSKSYPCYYVSGNHEYWSSDIEFIKQTISKYGIDVLEGKCRILVINGQKINICGIDDFETGEEEYLVLSGHSHGGQWRVP